MFADDTAVLAWNANLPEYVAQVNNELQKIANWLRSNRMAVNVSKTKFILFHTRGKKINEDELNVVLNMNEIGKILKSKIPSLFFRSKESILNTLSQPCDLTNCLEFILMNFYLLNNMLGFFVQNFRKSFTVYGEQVVSCLKNR